ncbi:hypothetical protein F7734_58240 [Scytonema sp. UIC 10036]|uniref:hypothetical protein n=1 Tax=Scytonema sp. UIC 10036 TaxID=2304196 RepID=UPI0012DA29F5|nr:hypothetical protein [Scytonema sp. UIC 10036]MUH01497.1 hypothetical protein [Scytonema sp. UIC 10036]
MPPEQIQMNQVLPPKNSKYKVTLLEIIAVFFGAIFLVMIGITGLAIQFTTNAFKPQRAEAIARSIMNYSFPDGSQGVLGLNLAGAQIALITSNGDNPDIRLLVARVVIDSQTDKKQVEQILDSTFLGDRDNFQVSTSRSEPKKLCGSPTQVTVEEGVTKSPDDAKTQFTISYKTSVVIGKNRYFVIVLAHGADGVQKAETVFNSLRCKLPES